MGSRDNLSQSNSCLLAGYLLYVGGVCELVTWVEPVPQCPQVCLHLSAEAEAKVHEGAGQYSLQVASHQLLQRPAMLSEKWVPLSSALHEFRPSLSRALSAALRRRQNSEPLPQAKYGSALG